MYLYQPCLLTMSLFAWAFGQCEGKQRWFRITLPLLILILSEWELTQTGIWIYPAALLLPSLFLFGRIRTVAWAESLTASLVGGLLCWKMADAWPLFPGITLLCAALLPVSGMVLCRSREDRFLACATGSLLFEIFFCLREYMLFSFCVVRLGSRDSLSLGAAAVCCNALFEQVRLLLPSKKTTVVST